MQYKVPYKTNNKNAKRYIYDNYKNKTNQYLTLINNKRQKKIIVAN